MVIWPRLLYSNFPIKLVYMFTCYWLEEFIQSRQADPWGQPLMSKINSSFFCPTLWSNNRQQNSIESCLGDSPLLHYLQLQAFFLFSTFFFVKTAISISWNHVCTGSLMAKRVFLIGSRVLMFSFSAGCAGRDILLRQSGLAQF